MRVDCGAAPVRASEWVEWPEATTPLPVMWEDAP
jgi:hypothetical protein